MTKYVEKEVIKKVSVGTVCDKCKKDIIVGFSDAFDFDFSVKTGNNYGDCGDGKEIEMDLCQTCSDELLELLKSKGFSFVETECDF